MNNRPTLEQRLERARALRASGHNCAQTVAIVFDDIDGAPSEADAARMFGPLGGGVSAQGLICGALSAGLMISALTDPADTPKARVYVLGRERSEAFERRFGSKDCRELKQKYKVACNDLIYGTITAIHNRLESESHD